MQNPKHLSAKARSHEAKTEPKRSKLKQMQAQKVNANDRERRREALVVATDDEGRRWRQQRRREGSKSSCGLVTKRAMQYPEKNLRQHLS
jgi:hypothetical protein